MTLYILSIMILVCSLVVPTNAWVMEPKVYTIYRIKKTWNEAREICHLNNNTLLSIPDNNLWQLWIDVLAPNQGPQYRGDSKYWFGLHSPNASIYTLHKWDDCSKVNWYQWNSGYRPTHPCVMFDVYFKPFTTVLMKLWRSEACNMAQQFICNRGLQLGKCIVQSCDEVVQEMDQQSCDKVCNGDVLCRSRLLSTSGVTICHAYRTESYPNSDFYTLCQLPPGNFFLQKCNDSLWDSNTSFNIKDTSPSQICDDVIEPDVTIQTTDRTVTTSTRATTPTTTTPISTTYSKVTSPALQCVCPCEVKTVNENLTIEQKVKQLKKALTVDKKNTSLHKRKFISVSDNRPSATGIGSFGAAVLVIVLLAIFLMDVGTLKADFTTMFYNLKSGLTGKNVKRTSTSINKARKTQFSSKVCTSKGDIIGTAVTLRPVSADRTPTFNTTDGSRPLSTRISRMSLRTPSISISHSNTAPVSHSLQAVPQGHIEFQKKLAQSSARYAGTKFNVLAQRSRLSSAVSFTRSTNFSAGDMKEMAHFSDRSQELRENDADKMSLNEKESPIDDEQLKIEDKKALIQTKGGNKKRNTWLKMV